MFQHGDVLDELNGDASLTARLRAIHGALDRQVARVHRVAVALYEAPTDLVKTFVHSSGGDEPLAHYAAKLAASPWLLETVARRRPRLVRDLAVFADSQHVHTIRILAQGYRTSYTLPAFSSGSLLGFVFFNSYEPDAWKEQDLDTLDVHGHLVALLVAREVTSIRTLLAAVRTTREFAHHRDPETGAHLDRMSRYARLVATELAAERGLSDDYVEHLFLFAPLHDVGKVAIPDSILLKPDALTPEQYEVMKTHAAKGREIVDGLLANFGLDGCEHVELLRNVAWHHHEKLDGTGYPDGLAGAAIPLEARIVAVADVFDALTSRRPYKPAWTNDEAFAALRRLAGTALDPACVAALERRRAEVEKVQAAFREDSGA